VKIIAMARIEVAIVNLIEKIIQRFDVLILRLRQVGNAVIFSKFARARIMREQQRWSTSKGRRDVPVNARTKGKVIPSQFFDPRRRVDRKAGFTRRELRVTRTKRQAPISTPREHLCSVEH